MENGYIESSNGRFRDECLNEQWFESLHQARSAIVVCQDYNEVRPTRPVAEYSRPSSPSFIVSEPAIEFKAH